MTPPDPYKVLQVDPAAEDEVIEAAYRRLARKYHPDVAPGPDAEARMVALNLAYDLLRDPVRRAAIDRTRSSAVNADGSPAATQPAPPSGRRGTGADGEQPHDRPNGTHGGDARGPFDPAPRRRPSDPRTPPDEVSRDWTSGRSSAGGGYDPATMGTAQSAGSAGPPPGSPSGTVLAFGRYAGWSLGEVARRDLEYLEWLDRVPIGRAYRDEIDVLLRAAGRRRSVAAEEGGRRGLFRRR